MKDTRLLDKFNEAKQILCRYDYYIHTPKKILHLTNGEQKIPHLMGPQYIAILLKMGKPESKRNRRKVAEIPCFTGELKEDD